MLYGEILLILYMGLRPVSTAFGDTINYAHGFYEIQRSSEPFTWEWGTDALFYNLHAWFAKYSDIHSFFLLCAFIYVGSLWLAMQRIFKSYYYIPLLVIFSMFTFWNYGVNGIRNGMGASVFILAMTYINRLPIAILLGIIAVGFHKSYGRRGRHCLVYQKQLPLPIGMDRLCRSLVCSRYAYTKLFGNFGNLWRR